MANPIYNEVIPRELTYLQQSNIIHDPKWFQLPNGNLNMDALIREFIAFYKRNAEMLTNRKTYTEAAHHLVFMAFLQRIVNGGGRIEREYASGLGRVDIMIQYGSEIFAIELKLYRKNVIEEASEQLYQYLQRLSLQEGWLIIFQKGLLQDWENVGVYETILYKEKTFHVVWM